MIGIYKILNKTTSRLYIGSSKNISQRWSKHKALLRHNRHDNKKLQNFWNKYSEEDFEFSVIEECLEEELLVREQYYLDTILFAQEYINKVNTKFDDIGLNITPIANGAYLTEESIKRISDTLKNGYKTGVIEKTNTKQCYQYNRFTGELIKVWEVINDACRFYKTSNCKNDKIHKCLWGKTLDAYDSIWTYEPVNFVWARRSQTRYTLVAVDVIENTYSFYDSIPEFLTAIGYTINSRQTLTKCINENKLFKNQYRCFKLEAPVIYDSKPFELLGHREDLITKTNEEILNVNV